MQSWKRKNPGWDIRFYDDEACLEFVSREFPHYLEAYRTLPKHVERSDFFRYMVGTSTTLSDGGASGPSLSALSGRCQPRIASPLFWHYLAAWCSWWCFYAAMPHI